MDVFLIGAAIGIVGGSVLSFVKNPYTGNKVKGDVRDAIDNFEDSVGRAKNIYHELEEKRMYPDQPKPVKTETDAESGASEKEKSTAEKETKTATADAETHASEHEEHKESETDAESGASEEKKTEVKQMKPTPKIQRVPQHVTLGEKAHDFVDAVTHASFKAIDHKKLFAMILGKNKKEDKKDNK